MKRSEWRKRLTSSRQDAIVVIGAILVCVYVSPIAQALAFRLPDSSLRQTIAPTGQENFILVQLQPPLRPKPGYIIGRAIGSNGKPVLALEITVKGFPDGSPIEYVEQFEPRVDPRSGYYEIRIEDGAYRISARWNKRARDSFPATVECLLMVEQGFVSADGISYAQQSYNESRRGIVKDFVWNPNPYDLEKCGRAMGL
jgi:hypothetical protein